VQCSSCALVMPLCPLTASTPDPPPLTGLVFTGTARTADTDGTSGTVNCRRAGQNRDRRGREGKGRERRGEGEVGPIMEADVG